MLGKVAKVYDPLGLAAPLTLVGKLIYRDACQQKKAWDAELSKELVKRWEKWEMSLPKEVPRTLVLAREPIEAIVLHAFGDASGQGVAAAVYAVVQQESGVRQGLVAAKARLAKQGLTIPRLHRPQCYCLSRHVLAVPMHGIITASIKLSDFRLLSSMNRRL